MLSGVIVEHLSWHWLFLVGALPVLASTVLIAKYGIYDLRQHLDEVIMPVLRKWKLFERTDFGPEGERLREVVADFLADLEKQAVKFEESRDRALARERERGEVLSV